MLDWLQQTTHNTNMNCFAIFIALFYNLQRYNLRSKDTPWIRCDTVSDTCRVQHDTNTTELCDFFKLLAMLVCPCPCLIGYNKLLTTLI